MNVKSEEKKIALRLLNKYADSYKGLEEENKVLRAEIKDLKTTLKINKEIIENFVKNTNLNEKNSSYIDKLNEENKTLNDFVTKLTKEKESLIKKLSFTEQVTNDSLNRTREETNLLKSKIFVYENIITKKESVIEGMRRKIEKIQDSELYKQEVYEREVYVVEPSLAVNQIYDELVVFKQIYNNLSDSIKDNNRSINKLEKLVTDLQNENTSLKEKLKTKKYEKYYNDHSNTPSTNTVMHISQAKGGHEEEIVKSPITPITIQRNYMMKSSDHQLTKSASKNEIKTNNDNKRIENEEWQDILKSVQLTREEIKKLKSSPALTKLFEALEMLNKLSSEKNFQIKIMEKENESLNKKNTDLNNENIKLITENNQLISKNNNLKLKISLLDNSLRKLDKMENSSLLNNTSNINCLKKFIENNTLNILNGLMLKKDTNGGDGEDSGVYNKNVESSTNTINCKSNKLEESEVDFQINEDLMKEIQKENSKVSQSSNHDSIIDLKQIKNLKSYDQCKLLKTIKKINPNNSLENSVPKNQIKAKKLHISQNYSTYQNTINNFASSNHVNNEKNARVFTLESGTSEIKENFMDSDFISGRKGFENF